MDQPTPTILVVEDAPELAPLLVRELQAAGFATLHAADGLTALEIHASTLPDAIILDWMLPGWTGWRCCAVCVEPSATPVLMLTARARWRTGSLGLEVGADDYLTKPFSMRELIARVRALLRRDERIRQTLSADRAASGKPCNGARTATGSGGARRRLLDGDDTGSDATEFALLQLLLGSPGRAFSRAYLLDTIWQETYIGGDRSVDNVVLRLRKKLGEVGDAIETVWGIGYRLRPEERR